MKELRINELNILREKVPECQKQSPSVFIVNFEHILHRFLVFLLSTLNRLMFAGQKYVNIYDY